MNDLVIKNLTKSYGKLKALDDVSLELPSGIYGLLGPNGAGKSTLMKILTTLLTYDSGSVTFNDEDLKKQGNTYRNIIGYMPQQQQLIGSESIEGFLYYMASLKGLTKKETAQRIVELAEVLGFKDRLNQRCDSLSGGYRQRVSIAQAMLNDPKILLLDEPTAGLDPYERSNFRNYLANTARDRIIILATHVISDIEFIANEIIILKDGKVLTMDTQENLLSKTKVYVTTYKPELLMKADPDSKIVNLRKKDSEILVRFISKKNYSNPQETTLDDVYLDWLG